MESRDRYSSTACVQLRSEEYVCHIKMRDKVELQASTASLFSVVTISTFLIQHVLPTQICSSGKGNAKNANQISDPPDSSQRSATVNFVAKGRAVGSIAVLDEHGQGIMSLLYAFFGHSSIT